MKKLGYALSMTAAVLLLVTLILSAAEVKASCYEALIMCARLLIPSLFPFFVLSGFLSRLGLPGILGKLVSPVVSRIYGISPAGASALIMGFIGGYPAGAAYIADMEKEGFITAREGERLIAFCNNSGPAFIVGVMGTGIFGSVKTGLTLYTVHIASALLTGLLFRERTYPECIPPHRLDETDTVRAMVDSVKQAVVSILNVSGFVTAFSVLLSLLDSYGLFALFRSAYAKAFLSGILELGSGAGALAGLDGSPITLALAAGMLSWGGLSVHFQTLAVLSESKIKGSLHLAGRLSSAITAFILMYLLSLI